MAPDQRTGLGPGIAAEPVRLVIWDLDNTFWHGTLTEGGIRFRPEACQLVVDLARCGIMNSICSKNRAIDVHRILDGRYFNSVVLVFDFINTHVTACLERTIRAISDPEATLMFHDQCALNIGFRDHFADLEHAWNTTVSEEAALADIGDEVALLHFLDCPKPWSAPYNGEAGPLWFETWAALAGSIGPGTALELFGLSEA